MDQVNKHSTLELNLIFIVHTVALESIAFKLLCFKCKLFLSDDSKDEIRTEEISMASMTRYVQAF